MSSDKGASVFWGKIRTLIVDDNDVDRMLLKAVLNKIGITDVTEAENSAVAEFKKETADGIHRAFHLFLIDRNMPGPDGIQLLKVIREKLFAKNPKPVVVMVTGTADAQFVKQALDIGIDDVVVKPVKLEVLQARLEKIFRGRNL